MTKFFVPAAKDAEQAERVFEAVCDFLVQQGKPLENRRIFALHYRHEGKQYEAEVGEVEPRTGEVVIVILKALNYGLYYVCTENRGVARGEPMLVGENEVQYATDFEPD